MRYTHEYCFIYHEIFKSLCSIPKNPSFFADVKHQSSVNAAAQISETSSFFACMSLDTVEYKVSNKKSSFSPFGLEKSLTLNFEKDTFEGDDTVLEFKVC